MKQLFYAAASLCSFCDIRLLHVATGHHLRACTADASTVGSATGAQLGGALAHSAVAGHAEPAAAVALSQFSGLKAATKCSGGPRVHVLRCASQRDHARVRAAGQPVSRIHACRASERTRFTKKIQQSLSELKYCTRAPNEIMKNHDFFDFSVLRSFSTSGPNNSRKIPL